MAGRRLAFNSPSTPQHGPSGHLSGSPLTDERRTLSVLSGLSRQIAQMESHFNSSISNLTTLVNTRFDSLEQRLATVEGVNYENANPRKRRRLNNPTIAEAAWHLHNAETNTRRYDPEQELTSPHNEEVTSFLLRGLSESAHLRDVDKDNIVSASKTCYETVRRNFRLKQPGQALKAEFLKSSARSHSRRKRLLEARRGVLLDGELDVWRCATVDLMSDEEDWVSGWVVRPPPFRTPEPRENNYGGAACYTDPWCLLILTNHERCF